MSWRRRAVGGLIAGMTLMFAFSAQAPASEGVLLVEVSGPITPVVADHLNSAISTAAESGSVVLVTIDTPGGLETSMRDIVQDFLSSPVPVIAYVQPEGARAASAGTFITMAAHIAAMAPATSIGAATPVDLQSGESGSDKIINDAAAFARSVAERRGRSVEFAEAAVREGTSLSASEALEQDVIDLISPDLATLLSDMDGLTVEIEGREVVLQTADAIPERHEMSTFQRILATIADPNIALLFLSIGTLAVVYEAANPGLGFAGVAGVILLLLGFFALSVLPVQTTGIALLILAFALFIGEVFVPGVGVLAAGGTIALLLAGVFLFEGGLEVSPPVLWPTALVLGLFTTLAGRAAIKARLRPSTTGPSTLIGRAVTVVEDDGEWSAFVDGSWWRVRPASGGLISNEMATVVAMEGLELVVDQRGEDDES